MSRALVVFADEKIERFSPVVYLHTQGEEVGELLQQCCTHMWPSNFTDWDYVAARFIGFCHEANRDTSYSIGVFPAPHYTKPAWGVFEGQGRQRPAELRTDAFLAEAEAMRERKRMIQRVGQISPLESKRAARLLKVRPLTVTDSQRIFDELRSSDYSHGDSGVFIVQLTRKSWHAKAYNGSGFGLVPATVAHGYVMERTFHPDPATKTIAGLLQLPAALPERTRHIDLNHP